MTQNRVRIVDVADALGLSTATVSKVIHGKTEKISEDIQMIGFDDSMASRESHPSLTTIHQEASLRAKAAIECLEAMRDGAEYKTEIVLPVDLIKRESTRKL